MFDYVHLSLMCGFIQTVKHFVNMRLTNKRIINN